MRYVCKASVLIRPLGVWLAGLAEGQRLVELLSVQVYTLLFLAHNKCIMILRPLSLCTFLVKHFAIVETSQAHGILLEPTLYSPFQ